MRRAASVPAAPARAASVPPAAAVLPVAVILPAAAVLPIAAVLSGVLACAPGGAGRNDAGPAVLLVSDRSGAPRIYEVRPGDPAARAVGPAAGAPAAYRDCAPARLPDGRIAFVSDRDGNPEIYLAAPDGRVERLTRDPPDGAAVDAEPAALGRDAIVFARGEPGDPDGAPADLYLLRLDGSPPRRLTHHPADDRTPAGSPDGSAVVFASDRGGGPAVYRLEDVRAADPERSVRLLAEDARAPAVLPDGSIVAVRAMRDGVPHLFHAAAGGGGRFITDSMTLPFGAAEPVVLPGGRILMTTGPAGPSAAAGGPAPRFAVYDIALGGINLASVTRERTGYSDHARGLSVCR